MSISSSPVHQAVGSGTGSPISVTITAPANGNSLLALIGINSKTSVRTVTGITGTGTSGWQSVGLTAAANGLISIEIWLGNVGAGAGTSISVTLSSSQINGACVNVSEWSGLDTATALNIRNDNVGTGTGPSIAPTGVNTPVAGELAIAAAVYANGTSPTATPSWGTPFTFANSGTTVGVAANYLVLPSSSTPATASWTITSAAWETESIYFAASAAANWLKETYWWQRATESSGVF